MTISRIRDISILICLLLPTAVWAFSSSPSNGLTGAPGEGNCTSCHSTFALNSGVGTLSVSDLSAWVPGQTYDLEVQLADPDASRWGMEFTILDAAGNSAGTLTSVDAATQLSTSGQRVYAKHTSAGTQAGVIGQASWLLQWTAPPADTGEVTLYAAGNAANGNGSPAGDRIYTIASAWSEGGSSPAPLPLIAGARLLPNYPNPFNPRTNVVFELDREQYVELAIYSVDGRRVRQLVSDARTEGRHEVTWDGLDATGRAVPSGTYFTRLLTRSGAQTGTMTLIR